MSAATECCNKNECCTEEKDVRQTVLEGYSKIAQSASSCCGGSTCGSASPDSFAQALGYSADELAELPEGANLGLSCGNPVALATLQPGETVIDLGSGGGFDIIIAGRKVSAKGKAIGVDMTPDMIARARKNAVKYRETTGLDNVEFRLGEIEHIPVADGSADIVISNCVINLSPDKQRVWNEMYRVLKPGGRVAVSDLALLQPLPQAVKEYTASLVMCISGAVLVSETERMLTEAGFRDIRLEPKIYDIDEKAVLYDEMYSEIFKRLPVGARIKDYITSLSITAIK